MEGLKPCPFCGGKAYLKDEVYLSAGNNLLVLYYVICDKCEIWTAPWTEAQTAIERWNRRAE